MKKKEDFKHVSYLWDEQKVSQLGGDEVALLVYRSNLLGADLRLTNYGGGNTSCKTIEKDPLSGKDTEVMWVKGSGGDLGTMKRNGLAGLYLERLRALKSRYRGLGHEDEMVQLFNHCIFDLDSKAPSIDTPLHAFLPFKHIDHLHPDAAIAIAAAADGERITRELFNGKIGWVPWQRPGFDLGLKLRECLDRNPGIRGIMLGSHGLFTWGETSLECYENTLDVIEQCASYLARHDKGDKVFGGQVMVSPNQQERRRKAAQLMPLLRHFCSSERKMIGHFSDDDRILEFINSADLSRLGPMGTSCPDHFLRTKISPLILKIKPSEDLSDLEKLRAELSPAFEGYRKMYGAYYEQCKHIDSPAMRDPNPVIILFPGIGMFSFARDKQTARVAMEFYLNAVNVMRGAEAVSAYTALPRQEAFNIEYWLLEEAKLKRMPAAKPLSGKIALVTGSGGGIGKAIAKKFAAEGACVVLSDNDHGRLEGARDEFLKEFGRDSVVAVQLDVTDASGIVSAIQTTNLSFGGLDIVVNNAGISISKPLENHEEKDWDSLYDILVKGQFLMSREAVKTMKTQKLGGDIINIVSKNALVAGPNNVGYGSAKAAQLHMTRLMAAELGPDKIRVNAVNPDAVIADSKIWAGAWAEGRANAYGIKVEDLPAYYAGRTLLNEIILPSDIANACFVLVGGNLNKSTGQTINVDGGLSAAFTR